MLCIFYAFLFIAKTTATEKDFWKEIFNTNGWRPISRERALHGFDDSKVSDFNFKQGYQQTTNNFGLEERNLESQENSRNLFEPGSVTFSGAIAKNEHGQDVNRDDRTENSDFQIISTTERYRKAKDISSKTFYNVVNDIASTQNKTKPNSVDVDTQQKEVYKNKNIDSNEYEVTENNEYEEFLKGDESNFNINKDLDNQYYTINKMFPANRGNDENDFTSKLLNILSNYNIRVNDVLPNYELSRETTRRSPPKQEFLLLPIPIRYSSRHNSLNHVTVDPLLAVFLSNYGYYLPGQYGSHNNYQNLYGYLASNNIHNNKPFGSYKIFADTDSSN
ncbi:unnamed protein product [Parnassius apollo]|uniref:(apollo) hypothetical protein n=1 Tax=Parnassius apollo TaxID=110799 RepID=A0A8S3WLD9_PARAO|nr:unnamed protein product [Parnassius apollo]